MGQPVLINGHAFGCACARALKKQAGQVRLVHQDFVGDLAWVAFASFTPGDAGRLIEVLAERGITGVKVEG